MRGVKNLEDILYTDKLSKKFYAGSTAVNALNNINLSILKNKLTILKGPSGSGKTTLINLLGALDSPSGGNIYFEDTDITNLDERSKDEIRRTKFGFVFQSVALVSMLTAYENVEFGLRIAGYPANGRKERAEQCLAMVGLQKRMHHLPSQLSGGEQQRVAIARAIAHKPSIIFADEPTAELDTHMSLQIVKVFKSLTEQENVTIVMTTHDPGMMDVADSIIELRDGVIVHGK